MNERGEDIAKEGASQAAGEGCEEGEVRNRQCRASDQQTQQDAQRTPVRLKLL